MPQKPLAKPKGQNPNNIINKQNKRIKLLELLLIKLTHTEDIEDAIERAKKVIAINWDNALEELKILYDVKTNGEIKKDVFKDVFSEFTD
jgi:hypothetical protein